MIVLMAVIHVIYEVMGMQKEFVYLDFVQSRDAVKKFPPKFRYFTIPWIKRYINISIARTEKYKVVECISSKNPSIQYRKQVFMADIDYPYPLELLIHNLADFQAKHDLSNIYIVSTRSGGYHLYCFRLFSLQDYFRLLVDCPCIDMKFVAWISRRYQGILRVEGEDLHHVAVLERKSSDGVMASLMHKLYYEKRFNVSIDEEFNWIGDLELRSFKNKIPIS